MSNPNEKLWRLAVDAACDTSCGAYAAGTCTYAYPYHACPRVRARYKTLRSSTLQPAAGECEFAENCHDCHLKFCTYA